jgi:hypothetical protein
MLKGHARVTCSCVLIALLCGTLCACRAHEDIIGGGVVQRDLVFPGYSSRPDIGDSLASDLGYYVQVGAELFEHKSPFDLLRDVHDVELISDALVEGPPHMWRFWGLSNFPSGPRFKYTLSGSEYLRNAHGWHYGDEGATRLMRRILGYLKDGIVAGKWVVDPNLERKVEEDVWRPIEPELRAPICRLRVHLAHGLPHISQDDPKMSPETGIVHIAVYYKYAAVEQGRVPSTSDGVWSPHVFLFGNRTTSHIFLLGHTEGVKLHDAALALYKRLKELEESRQDE